MLKVAVILTLAVVASASWPSHINPRLQLVLDNGSTANIIVVMANGTQSVLNSLSSQRFANRDARLNGVASALQAHAAKSQKHVLSVLSSIKDLKYYSLWISNKVAITAADASLVKKLAGLDGIAEIHEEHIIYIDEAIDMKMVHKSEIRPLAEQGIELIQAHLVWSQLGNNGASAVVANIDTGVRGTHEALRNNFLGNYGWFDPYFGALVPDDRNGHGTHTMGIIAGGLGIGVAPGARWQACRGCSTTICSQTEMESCGQFIACPTLADGSAADCSKAPHVVNNSWASVNGDTWFNRVIQAWKTAGIIPVFSSGNDGPDCGTVSSPADSSVGVIGVGATSFTDVLATFSSRGPTTAGQVKPDICAPGVDIRSATHTGDEEYFSMSGTNMAAPHITGVVGLLAAEQKGLTYARVEELLYSNTDRNLPPNGQSCGGIPENIFPNSAFGWGRVNAFKSVQALQGAVKA